MARMVMCNATKEKGDSKDFIKIKGKYYKSQEVYDNFMREQEKDKENFIKLYHKIGELIGYKDGYISGSIGGLVAKKIKNSKLTKEELYDNLISKSEYIHNLFGEIENHNLDANHILGIFKIIEIIPETITYGGCYEIKNKETDECYIGETINFFERFITHTSELYNGSHHCKLLQKSFNSNPDISNFTFTPLFIYPIKSKNREEEKHKILYLECAYYLKYVNDKKHLLNTVNPYVALKNNNVSLDGYKIDCDKVLRLLAEDQENILPNKIKNKISKELTTNIE